jgi:hypothetical protein
LRLAVAPPRALPRLAGFFTCEKQCSPGEEQEPVVQPQRRRIEDRLQSGNVRYGSDESEADAFGRNQRTVGEQADFEDALLVTTHSEAVEELADHDARLSHRDRLPVRRVGRGERVEGDMGTVDLPEEREHHAA